MPTPTLKRSWAFVGCSSNNAGVGNNFVINLEASGTPCAMASGDLVILAVRYPHSLTSITVTDNKSGGSNTYTSQVSGSDSGLNNKFAIFTSLVTGFASQITVAFNTNTSDVQIYASLWYNVASSSIVDGTSFTADITPANNTNPNVSAGSMTTTVDGDLIFYIAFDQASPLGIANTINSTAWGSGFSGLFAETNYNGSAAQYEIQATHGAVNPGMLFSQTTHDTFAALGIAIKAGSSGSAPGAGIRIVKSQQFYNNVQASVNLTTAFPTSGNLFVAVNEAGTVGITMTSVTDSKSNTWTEESGHPATFPQIFYAANPTSDNAMTVTLHFGAGTGTDLICLYDIAGAATSPLDTGATVPGGGDPSALTAASSGAAKNSGTQGAANQAIDPTHGAPSIIPTTATGLIIAAVQMGDGPVTGSSQTFDYMSATWSTAGDAQSFSNGDAMGHVFQTSAANQSFHWTCSGQTAASSWAALAISFLAAPPSTPAVAIDDGDAQQQAFSQRSRMEAQHQQELQDTFGILPTRPPFAFEDDGQNMHWSDWRALQYEEVDVHRSLPPIPPFAITHDEGQDQKNASWSAIQHEDTDTHRALPPTPPFAIVDEISERFLPGVTPFVEEDQPGKPIIVAPAPNVGLDDIEAHVKAFDRVATYHEDDVFNTALAPPLAQQDEISERTFNWSAPAVEDDWRALPPTPPFVVPDDAAERWTASSTPQPEDDQATLPPVPPIVPFSIQDDEQHSWRGWLAPHLEADWSASAPVPPLAFEDDLKTISSNPAFFPLVETDLVGIPPLPGFFGDDESSLRRYVAAGLSGLILLDEFVGAPIVSGVGPTTIGSLSASVRPGIDSQSAAVRPGIDSQFAATRPAIDSLGATVRPS